jgi:hypothetical protein
MINEEALIDFLLEPLREYAKDKPAWEWIVIGDCWLESWNIARRIELKHGIDHQKVLTYIWYNIRPSAEDVKAEAKFV